MLLLSVFVAVFTQLIKLHDLEHSHLTAFPSSFLHFFVFGYSPRRDHLNLVNNVTGL